MRSRGPWRPVFDDSSRWVDRFGALLALVIATTVMLALVDLTTPEQEVLAKVGSVTASTLAAVTLMLALRSSGLNRRWLRIADVILLITIIGLIVFAVTSSILDRAYNPNPAPIFVVVFAAAAPIVVIRRLINHREVTRGTLLGAICGYLLIAIAFFFLFLSSAEYSGVEFFGSVQPSTSFMYFSLTSITTVGYGDLVPVTSFGRLLANADAVIGQVYLVTFVAMMVGLYAAARGGRRVETPPADHADSDGPDSTRV
jgi:hypothetical protein